MSYKRTKQALEVKQSSMTFFIHALQAVVMIRQLYMMVSSHKAVTSTTSRLVYIHALVN
jgi:hypothetical protein